MCDGILRKMRGTAIVGIIVEILCEFNILQNLLAIFNSQRSFLACYNCLFAWFRLAYFLGFYITNLKTLFFFCLFAFIEN